MVTTTTNVHGATAQLMVFTKEEGETRDFAVFTYGDPVRMTSVFLTVKQTVALAAQFAAAVGKFHPVAA